MQSAGDLDVSQPRDVADPEPDEAAAVPSVALWVRALQLVFLLLFAFTTWRLAWMSDDALITVRAALNLNEGLGPVYNADERVQAYTHPLWMLVIWATGAISGSWVYGLLYVSMAIAVIAVAIMLWRTTDPLRLVFLGFALLLSNTFVEWTSSGLEGPLAVLLTVLCWYQLRPDPIRKRPILIGLLVAALVLTRTDFLVVVLPILVYLLRALWSQRAVCWKFAAAVVAPVAVYYFWAWTYFGFALPATYYAKTNTTIPKSELVGRGLDYLFVSVNFDFAGFVVIVLASVFALLAGTWRGRIWMAGVWLYLCYIVWVGGDFMAGRFLLVPIVVSLLVVVGGDTYQARANLSERGLRILLGAGTAVMIVFGFPTALVWHSTTFRVPMDPGPGDVIDERGYYADRGRALDPLETREVVIPQYMPFTLADNEYFAQQWFRGPSTPTGQVLVVCGSLGNAGLWLGPSVHLIDTCGLSDMFVAQIPHAPGGKWRIGHFERHLPDGYRQAVETGDPNMVVDPQLRAQLIALWERIR